MVNIYAQENNNVMINLFAGEFYVQLNGQKVYSQDLAKQSAGTHNFTWDGVNNHNKRVASGLYLFRIRKNNNEVSTAKGILLK